MRVTLIGVAVVLSAYASGTYARALDLDDWMNQELIPELTATISTHPRFKDETLLFVVLANNEPAPVSNSLAIGLRDRIFEAAVDTPGVTIAWQQRHRGGCREDAVDYMIGLEISRELSGGQYALSIRALDVAEATWVSGFRKVWRGRLSSRELAAFRATSSDPAFLGTRDVPYDADQVDLIAKHLSHQLACDIHGSFRDDYVVSLDSDADGSNEVLPGAVTLAARNLDQQNALALTGEPGAANAEVHGKAHPIAGGLHQYWLSITPLSRDADLDSLSRSVYVNLPRANGADEAALAANALAPAREQHSATSRAARIQGVEMPGSEPRRLLQPLKVYRDSNCRDRDCSVLQARASDDIIVYTLVNTVGRGLKRLGDDACRARSAARVVTRGHSALFPVPGYTGPVRSSVPPGRWLLSPTNTTYYAIAIDNAHDARRVASIIDELPAACAGRSRAGLSGIELQQWLDRLSQLMLALGQRAQWRALEVNPIY
ncbi:MAG: hypothetical protein QNJ05_11635 [Woeseiaceae bacterium]|nr:hypothetical protein [Woeseiaceae bacterium]